jgi:hypothetical protein
MRAASSDPSLRRAIALALLALAAVVASGLLDGCF